MDSQFSSEMPKAPLIQRSLFIGRLKGQYEKSTFECSFLRQIP